MFAIFDESGIKYYVDVPSLENVKIKGRARARLDSIAIFYY